MAAVIELELPTEEFALEETLTTVPEAQVEIERVVATDPDRLIPYAWVHTDDFDAFEAALEDDPTVESVTMLSENAEERSYEMAWIGSIELVVRLLTEHHGTITHADGSAGGWHLRVVFPDHDSLSEACNSTRRDGFQFNVRAIYGVEDTRRIQYGLTEKQRNILVSGFEEGYFDIPREVTLTEFAEQQDLSHQAVSERLRRATRQLIESTLVSYSDE